MVVCSIFIYLSDKGGFIRVKPPLLKGKVKTSESFYKDIQICLCKNVETIHSFLSIS